MKITNIAKGPRGFWHSGTLTVLAPGETAEHDLDEQSLAGVKGAPESFQVGGAKAGKAKKDEGDGDPKTAAEVLAMADGNFMAFKSAASKLLGDATPAKKDDIVAALEDLATKPE